MPASSDKTPLAEPNPAWVAFFAEAMRLAELARQRQAAREENATGVGEKTNEVGPLDRKQPV